MYCVMRKMINWFMRYIIQFNGLSYLTIHQIVYDYCPRINIQRLLACKIKNYINAIGVRNVSNDCCALVVYV